MYIFWLIFIDIILVWLNMVDILFEILGDAIGIIWDAKIIIRASTFGI